MPWRKEKNIGMTDASGRIGISPERLRFWEQKGVILPEYFFNGAKKVRRYSEEDIQIGREIKEMIDEGFTLKGAALRLNRPYIE